MMKRIDYYFVQNKICQYQYCSWPSKQSEVHIDAGEHLVDKEEADDHDHGHGAVSVVSQVTSHQRGPSQVFEVSNHTYAQQ